MNPPGSATVYHESGLLLALVYRPVRSALVLMIFSTGTSNRIKDDAGIGVQCGRASQSFKNYIEFQVLCGTEGSSLRSPRGGPASSRQSQDLLVATSISVSLVLRCAGVLPATLLALIDSVPLENGAQHLGLMDLLRRDLEEILVDDNEVGGLAGLDGAGLSLLLHGHGTVSREDLNRRLYVDTFVRIELTIFGLAAMDAKPPMHMDRTSPIVILRSILSCFAVICFILILLPGAQFFHYIQLD